MQICKIPCEFCTWLRFTEFNHYLDFDLDPILKWIGFEQGSYLSVYRTEKDAYVEDKLTVSLLLLAGSYKVCFEI